MAATGSHAPNKHPSIEIVLLHADTVAENGSARKRAGGINSDNTNSFYLLARNGGEFVSDSAFARPRRSRNAHTIPPPEGWGNTLHNPWDLSTVPFNMRHELRQRPLVTSEHSLNEIHRGIILHVGAQGATPTCFTMHEKNLSKRLLCSQALRT